MLRFFPFFFYGGGVCLSFGTGQRLFLVLVLVRAVKYIYAH